MITPAVCGNGLLLQILSSCLQLWIRSHCSTAKKLQLTLQGTTLGLLSGQLEGVTLQAQKVIFQDLPISQARLCSEPIRFEFHPGHSQTVQLEECFAIEGSVTLTSKDLSQALLSPSWRWLGNQLAEQLIGLRPLESVVIDNDCLELQAKVSGHGEPARGRFQIWAESGTIILQSRNPSTSMALPMDPAIWIDQAEIAGEYLYLCGHATIKNL